VISEARLDDARRSYIEVSNVGADTINLGDFEIGTIVPWQSPLTNDYAASANYHMMFPNQKLAPGATFMIAAVFDWGPEMFLLAPEDYDPFLTKKEMWTLADVKLDFPESSTNAANDNITPTYHILEFWGGRDCVYLRQHFYNDTDTGRYHVDSVLIDQVNGIWRAENGTRGVGLDGYGAVDVAGFTNATSTATLIRKFSVKQGNMDFETGRGEDALESEWMTVPHQAGGSWADNVRRLFWTAKNHGDYNLTADYLVPGQDDISIDFDNSVITLPWGVRRDDSVIFRFNKVPGVAWHYDYNDSYADSAKTAACTGDTLTVYVAGNDLDMKKFHIEVTEPTDDAKIAVPKKAPNAQGFYAGVADPVYTVTDGLDMDTIGTARFGGIPWGTRIDTLAKYLEIPGNASYEVEWMGGTERTDLQNGDIFRVVAHDGTTKDYFVKVDRYRASHNAYLTAVNWPDMPEEIYGSYGFKGDTIPNFTPTKYDYIVTIPETVTEMPALIPHKQDLNSTIAVTRASSLDGTLEGRTIKYKVTAEDDTTIRNYSVQVNKEIANVNKEVFAGDPFISQFVWQEQWSSAFMEVVNPGNVNLDMSHYMFAWGYVNTPAAAITRLGTVDDWANRYGKYIPGYKWVPQADWSIKPAMVTEDVAVNANVLPGDVFVIGDVRTTGQIPANDPTREVINGVVHWWATKQCDVDLATGRNPWGEDVPNWNALQQWSGANWYLFRIENDSILEGTKPATDPNDFTLIDVFGSGDGTDFNVGGKAAEQIISFIRKPEITQGNPVFKGSFGTDAATSEWTYTNRAYYDARGVPWPYDILYVTEDIGSHYMKPTTVYRSTVTSPYVKVSPGFGDGQTIEGIAENSTVQFVADHLIKINDGQSFVFMVDTDTLAVTDTVPDGAVLYVHSANQLNTTTYALAVGAGLGRDAHLTSEVYSVADENGAGTVEGIEPGTTLVDALANVAAAEGAKITVLDSLGAYIASKVMGADSLYAPVQVNDNMFLEVVSESRLDTIVYKLELASDATSAFVLSDIYVVTPGLIKNVPYGTTAAAFMANLYPCKGATIKVVDKFGFERIFGDVVGDDILVVTSEDGTVSQSYFLQMLGGSPSAIFVISEVYLVDQVGAVISSDDITDKTTVAAFVANLVASEGATIQVFNANNVEKTSGTLATGDIVVVTGPDGETQKFYDIDVHVGVNNVTDNNVIVYPNPGRGLYHLNGVKAGNRITVTNILGAKVLERAATSDNDVINIERENNGFYFITVSDGNKVVNRIKVVKE
jgi:hypothetical protein